MIDQCGLGEEFLRHDDRLDRRLDLRLSGCGTGRSCRRFRRACRSPGEEVDFVEDAEDLVGVDGAESEIVVGIAAVVEVEAAEHVFDRAARRRSARCSARGSGGRCRRAPWPAVRLPRQRCRPCPSRRYRCGRTPARRACIRRASLLGARSACAARRPSSNHCLRWRMFCGAGIVGAVGKPERDDRAVDGLADRDGVRAVLRARASRTAGRDCRSEPHL